jgi:hypothetical protein
MNIGKQQIPADNTGLFISLGKATYFEPTVPAVSASNAMLNASRLLGFDRTPQLFDYLGKVIRMD